MSLSVRFSQIVFLSVMRSTIHIRYILAFIFLNIFIYTDCMAMKRKGIANGSDDISKKMKTRSKQESICTDLLHMLENNDFRYAKNSLQKVPNLLNNDKQEIDQNLIGSINAVFALKFLMSRYHSGNYQRNIKKLVHAGFDLDIRNEQGTPLLSLAIQSRDDRYLDLLRGGASINIHDAYGNTPLDYAIKLGDTDKIEKLLLYGAAVNENTFLKYAKNDAMGSLVKKIFYEQRCFDCKSHQDDLFSIPCVNRHLGHFLCKLCYDWRCARVKGCPFCRRGLGQLGDC